MTGLLSFLIFAAFFFVMMRFGCGAHIGHGGHRKPGPDTSTGATDPVCGMRVDPSIGYAQEYRGVRYRFCSRDCLDKFDATPDQYAEQPPHSTGHSGHSA